jgi:uncharacterized protein YkwD
MIPLRTSRAVFGRLAATLVALISVFAVFGAPSGALAATTPVDTSTYASRVVQLVNTQRANAGLKGLVVNTSLASAAQNYAGVLSTDACFAHTCPPVPDLGTRLNNAGYTFNGYHSWTYGENIAAGYQTPESVVAGWMASAGHRANILNSSYRDTGVGIVYKSGTRYGFYWVQDFGARS